MQLTVVEVGLAIAATHRPLVRFALLDAEAGRLSFLCDCTFPASSTKHIGTDLGFAPYLLLKHKAIRETRSMGGARLWMSQWW